MGIMFQTHAPVSPLCFVHTPAPQRLAVKSLFHFFLFICTRISFFTSTRLPWWAQLCCGCPSRGTEGWSLLCHHERSPQPRDCQPGCDKPQQRHLEKGPRQTWATKIKHLAKKFIYGEIYLWDSTHPSAPPNGCICIGNKSKNSEIQQRAVCSQLIQPSV